MRPYALHFRNGLVALLALWPGSRGTGAELATVESPRSLPAPDFDYAANHCEFFVNSLGYESSHFDGAGFDERRFVSYVSVNERDLVAAEGGRILRVGLLANGSEYLVGERVEPAYYRIALTLYARRLAERSEFELREFAYFVDVERRSGVVDRLWLQRGDRPSLWPSVFEDYPRHLEDGGTSYRAYVLEPSPIYDQRRACRR